MKTDAYRFKGGMCLERKDIVWMKVVKEKSAKRGNLIIDAGAELLVVSKNYMLCRGEEDLLNVRLF